MTTTKKIKPAKPVLLIYSGGMDSFTLLHDLLTAKYSVQALSFHYGQKHKKELQYATAECDRLKIPHDIIRLHDLTLHLTGSALTDTRVEMPTGHYAADKMRMTVVPGRNSIMLAIAMGIAQARGCSAVYYGAHAGDHHIYPDCRPGFVRAMRTVYGEATESSVDLIAPYINLTKTDILSIGLSMHLDYANAWTCYEGGDVPCGKCGSCTERAEAFAVNNAVDPFVPTT